MHRQATDIPAGKLQRLHGETVGGDHLPTRRQDNARSIRPGIELTVAEMTGEDLVDQLTHQASAVAMGQADVGVLQIGSPAKKGQVTILVAAFTRAQKEKPLSQLIQRGGGR